MGRLLKGKCVMCDKRWKKKETGLTRKVLVITRKTALSCRESHQRFQG